MAKNGPGRMLRTSFFQSADLMDLPHWASKLWASMFVHADDYGFIGADAGWLRGVTWPHGKKRGPFGECRPPAVPLIRTCLGVFEDRNMITRGRGDPPTGADRGNGEVVTRYHITNFDLYQDVTAKHRGKGSKKIVQERARPRGSGDGDGDGFGGGTPSPAPATQGGGRVPAGGRRDHPRAAPTRANFEAVAAAALAAQGGGQ